MQDDLLLTREEIDALLRVVENVQTTVKSAQSWIDLQNKLQNIRKQFDLEPADPPKEK